MRQLSHGTGLTLRGFFAGIVTGTILFGSVFAYAAAIAAQPKTASVLIDGKTVDLKGYLIEGTHYFQLRDLSAALKPGSKDFSIVWDSKNNQIMINTSRGYDPGETIGQTPAAPEMTIDEMKAEIIRLTNAEREKAGVPALIELPELMDCAQAKADDMRDNNYYGHNSPVYGPPEGIIRTFIPNVKSGAENLAPWAKTPDEAFAGWVASPEHYKHIIDPKYTHIGVGILKGAEGGYWWVQHFASF